MRIIFLDIDGVLNTHADYKRGMRYPLNESKVRLFNEVLEVTQAWWVLSSTWRRYNNYVSALMMSELNTGRMIGMTGSNHDGIRGDEVDEWIREFAPEAKYCCLDDDNDFHPYNNLIKCENKIGLTGQLAMDTITFFA